MDRKLRVVWVTHVSNKKIREHLNFDDNLFERFVRRVLHRPRVEQKDNCQWITNGLNEYEKCQEIELHLVAPHANVKGIQEFDIDGIYYHIFRSEGDYPFFKRLLKHPPLESEYKQNRKVIGSFINRIKPDIVHVFGAENPMYSLSVLDIDPDKIPLIVSLQTLMSTSNFKENYFLPENEYNYRSECERLVLKHTRYIGSKVSMFKDVVWKEINPDAIFLPTTLFVGEEIHDNNPKEVSGYDIIYFAKDIAKAADISLKVLAIIRLQKPNVKMCVVGGCNASFRPIFERLIDEMDVSENINYLGSLPTHDDVIKAVRNARVALLPVKVDGITGTMREAMANGLPVVTTETWGTTALNKDYRCAFVEKLNDYEALAKDVVTLLDNKDVCAELRENGFRFIKDHYSNNAIMKKQNEVYHALDNLKRHGTPIPSSLCDVNTNRFPY